MRVIGTVGMPGSGKDEFSTAAQEAGVPVVSMGDVIREECRERGLDPAEHHGRIASALREEDGEAAIAQRTLPHVESALEDPDTGTVVVDGLRSPAEVTVFCDRFGDAFEVASIEAPFGVRADRLAERGRDETDLNRKSLREREQRELDHGMGEVIENADVRIDNTGTIAEFHRSVRRFVTDGPEAVSEPDR